MFDKSSVITGDFDGTVGVTAKHIDAVTMITPGVKDTARGIIGVGEHIAMIGGGTDLIRDPIQQGSRQIRLMKQRVNLIPGFWHQFVITPITSEYEGRNT